MLISPSLFSRIGAETRPKRDGRGLQKQTEVKLRKEKEKYERELKKIQKERDRAEEQKRLAEQGESGSR